MPSALADRVSSFERIAKSELDLLKQLRSPINPNIASFDAIEAVIEYCNSWATKRHDLPYETDGMVIKIDDLGQRQKLGVTSKSPRHG